MKIYSKLIKDTKYFNIINFIPFYDDKALYIDIETTGFRRTHDMIYLVGLLYIKNNELTITQFLCEKPEDEYELLFKLNQLISEFKTLVHFNGDSFDIPFIKSRMNLYRMKENLSKLNSFDFYKKLRPFKKLLGTDNLKLKTIEKLCGYKRIDPFTGGELIGLYKHFQDGDLALEYSFIIHNEEDMIALYYINSLLPVIAYYDKFSAEYFHPLIINLATNYDFRQAVIFNENIYTFSLTLNQIHIELTQESLNFSFSLITGTKYLFFDDYKNYFYLPTEDIAIHKSVADYMPSRFRKKATAQTAYIQKEDTFIMCPLKKALVKSLIPIDNNIYIFNDNFKENYCYILSSDFASVIQYILPTIYKTLLL